MANSHQSDKSSTSIDKGRIFAAGSSMTGSVLGMGALGYYLDHRFGWTPWGTLGGLLLGAVAGMYELHKILFAKSEAE